MIHSSSPVSSYLGKTRLHQPRSSFAYQGLFLSCPGTRSLPAVKSPPQCALCEVSQRLLNLGLLVEAALPIIPPGIKCTSQAGVQKEGHGMLCFGVFGLNVLHSFPPATPGGCQLALHQLPDSYLQAATILAYAADLLQALQ